MPRDLPSWQPEDVVHMQRSRRRRRARRQPLDRTDQRYFVYRLYDSAGICIYIGRSCDVQARLRAHIRTTDWAITIASLDMTGPYSWDQAVLVEGAQIKEHQPLHNKLLTEEWTRQRYSERSR